MSVGPFERHIREAIELNRRRAPRYAEASAGVSLAVSRALIRRERMLLPLARWLDRRAARYQRAGIPLLDDLFVSMSRAPDFVPLTAVGAPVLPPPVARPLVRSLRKALRSRGFAAAAALLDRELERLGADPAYWCMHRHLLESAVRISVTAPHHVEQAQAAGLPSPEWIHRLIFHLHLAALPGACRLDARALPLQKAGIPILCRDLPPIPRHP